MQIVQDPKGFANAFPNGTGPRAQSELQQEVRTAQSRPVIGLLRATRRPCASNGQRSTKCPYFNVRWLLTALNLLFLILRFVTLSFKRALQQLVPRRTNADSRYITSFCVPRRVNYDQQSQAVPFEQIIDFYMHDSDSDLLDYCMRQAGPTLEQRVRKRLAAQRSDQRLCNSNIVCELPNERTAETLNWCERVNNQYVALSDFSRSPKPDPMAIKLQLMEYVWTPIETALESELVEPPSQYEDSAICSIYPELNELPAQSTADSLALTSAPAATVTASASASVAATALTAPRDPDAIATREESLQTLRRTPWTPVSPQTLASTEGGWLWRVTRSTAASKGTAAKKKSAWTLPRTSSPKQVPTTAAEVRVRRVGQ